MGDTKIKVKGVYLDQRVRLLLIQTPESAIRDRFTFPGGTIYRGEEKVPGLIRRFTQETGFLAPEISAEHFMMIPYEKDPSSRLVETYAYWTNVTDNRLNGEYEGHTPNGTKFKFIRANSLDKNRKLLTLFTLQVIDSAQFRGRVERMYKELAK